MIRVQNILYVPKKEERLSYAVLIVNSLITPDCLQYLKDLPYQCKLDFYGGISRKLNDEKKCYNFNLWGIGGAPPVGREPRAEYPHQVLLGYGDDLKSAMWQAGGFIISDRFIVTAAHAPNDNLKYLATGVQDRSASPETWQIRQIKRVIKHPEYKAPSKYYDIALIETDSPIKFDENVLPVCLHVDETANIEEAVATTWLSLDKDAGRDKNANTIQTIALEEFSEEECKAAYRAGRRLKNGYDHVTQMCYGSKTDKTNPHETCKGLSGEPLLIRTQFSRCIHTAIGISSFGKNNCIPKNVNTKSPPPDVYTRVSHYVPWIESIVWP